MAQQISVALVDDLDGSEASETVRFALDDIQYEIDLCAVNADKMRGVLQMYAEHARKAGTTHASVPSVRTARPPRPPRNRTAQDKAVAVQNEAIRTWANERGVAVAIHGRIPRRIRLMYENAHPAGD